MATTPTTVVTNTPVVGRTSATGTPIPDNSPFTVNQSIVTNTTTIDTALANVVTSYSYIPNMRSLDIDFVGYGLRPYRKIYYYFDNNMVNKFVQRPNMILTSSVQSPVDIKAGHREFVQIGTSVARVIHVERDMTTGNTALYLGEFANAGSIAVGATITSQNSSYTAKVVRYEHNSGKVKTINTATGYSQPASTIQFSSDANSANNDWYKGNVFTILSGSQAGQSAEIVSYQASTRTATVIPAIDSSANGQYYSIGDRRYSWAANTVQAHYITP